MYEAKTGEVLLQLLRCEAAFVFYRLNDYQIFKDLINE